MQFFSFLVIFFIIIFLNIKIEGKDEYFTSLIQRLEPNQTIVNELKVYRDFPKCMNHWLEGKRGQRVSQYIDDFFKDVKHLIYDSKTGECIPNHSVVLAGTHNVMHDYFGHFPHFALIYFRFYSTLLWQQRRFNVNHPCVTRYSVNETSPVFWNSIESNETNMWMKNALMTIHNVFDINSITTDYFQSKENHTVVYMPWMKVIYLHPADGLLLTSTLLRTNPCLLYNSSTKLINQHLNILILTRKDFDRLLLNADEVQNYLLDHQKELNLSINNISMGVFEGLSLKEQVQTMVDVDIFIGVHGAAFTNTIFMKPCSIVIEVFPWLFTAFAFFNPFFRGSEKLHYSWMVDYNQTQRFHDDREPSYCPAVVRHYFSLQRVFQRLNPTYYNQLHHNMSYFYSSHSLSARCLKDWRCEKCTRTVLGVNISVEILAEKLQQALIDRQKCIAQNEFYNPFAKSRHHAHHLTTSHHKLPHSKSHHSTGGGIHGHHQVNAMGSHQNRHHHQQLQQQQEGHLQQQPPHSGRFKTVPSAYLNAHEDPVE
jgi:hypothetical protein